MSVTLNVKNVAGLPSFKMAVAPADSILSVTKAAARKANIVDGKGKHFHNVGVIRLSMGVKGKHAWLNPKDSVEALGMRSGACVMLHINNVSLAKSGHNAATARVPVKLEVHTFASSGYGFWVNLVSPAGRHLGRRIKLQPHEDLSVTVAEARRKMACKTLTLKYKRHSGETVKLAKGTKVVDLGIGQDGDLMVFGLPDQAEELPPSSPRPSPGFSPNSFGSFHKLARPGTAPAKSTSSAPFLPVGPTNWP